MRPRLALLLVPVLLGAAPAAAPAATSARPWATVNLCDAAQRPGAVGVRVAMPAGPGAQWMRVRIQYYDAGASVWRLAQAGGDGGWTRLGSGRARVRGGTTFTFAPPSAGRRLVLRGVVDLQWRRGARVRRRASLKTTAGHAEQAGGTSAAQCVVQR